MSCLKHCRRGPIQVLFFLLMNRLYFPLLEVALGTLLILKLLKSFSYKPSLVSLFYKCKHYCFNRMLTVFCFVPNFALWTFKHFFCNFLFLYCGQTVHEYCVLLAGCINQ